MPTTRDLKPGEVLLIFWVRTPSDAPNSAGGTGSIVIPAKGCIARARHLDTYGDRALHVQGGHGVTIQCPSGRTRDIRANS